MNSQFPKRPITIGAKKSHNSRWVRYRLVLSSGSFWGKGMEELKWPFLLALGFVFAPYFFIKKMNVLIFDDETIVGLGESL